MRCLYRERRYVCGDYMEVDVFPVFRTAGTRKGKAKPTSETQERLNQRNAERKLIRLLHANFCGEDVEVHLTYRPDAHPETEEEARRDVRNFLRRVKARRIKLGLPELKYISVTEGGGKKRYHHHVTMSGGISRDELEELWGYGYANAKKLQFGELGVEGLARYVLKGFRNGKKPLYGKRWNASKNLIHPEPQDRDGKISQKAVRMIVEDPDEARKIAEKQYPGYICAEARTIINDYNGGSYVTFAMYRNDAAFLGASRRRKERAG